MATAVEAIEVEGHVAVDQGWLRQWHQEIAAFIPGFRLVERAVDVHSQDTQQPAAEPEVSDRDLQQLIDDQEEVRELQRMAATACTKRRS